MGASGTTTIDFGAFPGTTMAQVTVTGQASIGSTSLVEAWIFPTATSDHNEDEHIVAAMLFDVIAGTIVAGTGFTIYAVAREMGGEPLELPGVGRRHVANGTVGQNTMVPQGVVGSVGGTARNRLHGQWTIAWVWN